jgi:hypothetical protein
MVHLARDIQKARFLARKKLLHYDGKHHIARKEIRTMTQEEKDDLKLAAFKKHAQWIIATNPEDKAVYLLKDKTDSNNWGFLVVSMEGESLDNHCGDCKRESVLFYKFRGTPEMPYPAMFGIVGPTKFKRILDGSEKDLLGKFGLREQIGGYNG